MKCGLDPSSPPARDSTVDLRLVLGAWDEMRADAEPVRRAVFVHEQGCTEASEWDEFDAVSVHCVAYAGNEAVGTGRLLPAAKIGRMAVVAAHRHRGFASRILQRLLAAAVERGDAAIVLHAQVAVIDFYRRHGFHAEGDQFLEEGIPHVVMRRPLGPDKENTA